MPNNRGKFLSFPDYKECEVFIIVLSSFYEQIAFRIWKNNAIGHPFGRAFSIQIIGVHPPFWGICFEQFHHSFVQLLQLVLDSLIMQYSAINCDIAEASVLFQ